MSVAAGALDQADPSLLRRAAEELEVDAPRLSDVVDELHDVIRRTSAGWSGAGHGAWDRKVTDLADRTEAAAGALAQLDSAITEVASAATAGQEQLRAVATTAAALFGESLALHEVRSAAVRAHYDGVLLDARRSLDDVAERAPAAPTIPVVCPPPPAPPERPWWDDLLFGVAPVVLDSRCQPLAYLEGGGVPKPMLKWLRQIGRADKLDEPVEVLRQRVVTSESWAHLSGKHTTDWFGGTVATKATKEAFEEVVIKALRSKKVYNGSVRTDAGRVPTLNHFYNDGSKRLLVQLYLDGPRARQLAAVRIPNQVQLTAVLRSLRAVG